MTPEKAIKGIEPPAVRDIKHTMDTEFLQTQIVIFSVLAIKSHFVIKLCAVTERDRFPSVPHFHVCLTKASRYEHSYIIHLTLLFNKRKLYFFKLPISNIVIRGSTEVYTRQTGARAGARTNDSFVFNTF